MIKDLPSPVPGAADVAKLTTGVGAALAALLFPGAAPEIALAAPFLPFAIDKFIERPKKILIEALRSGRLEVLSDEQAAEYVPMAFRFMEAARQGEYEHTLKVLAAFIAGETKAALPDAGNFARMARRLEGISMNELRLIAHIAAAVMTSADPRWVSLSSVKGPSLVGELRDDHILIEGLHELSRRGLLVPVRDMKWNASHDGFEPSDALRELVSKAGSDLGLQSGPVC